MIGPWEWALIALVALLVFGGSRIGGVGKGVARSIREFKEELNRSDKQKKPDITDSEGVQPPEIKQHPDQPQP